MLIPWGISRFSVGSLVASLCTPFWRTPHREGQEHLWVPPALASLLSPRLNFAHGPSAWRFRGALGRPCPGDRPSRQEAPASGFAGFPSQQRPNHPPGSSQDPAPCFAARASACPLNGSCLIAVIASGVDASSSLASSSLEEQTTSSVAGTQIRVCGSDTSFCLQGALSQPSVHTAAPVPAPSQLPRGPGASSSRQAAQCPVNEAPPASPGQ